MVDSSSKLQVNDSEQWIYVRGKSNGAILLFVHGGPGCPLMPFARAFEAPFLKNYLVIHWEQRGLGRSFQTTNFSQGFSLDQFVDDGISVSQQLRKRYPEQPIILVGHSWGTVIGVKMAAAEPHLFDAYISIGTNSDSLAAENYRYEILEAGLLEDNNLEELAALKKIGRPPWIGERWDQWGKLIGEHAPKNTTWGRIPLGKVQESLEMCLENEDYTEQELNETFTKGFSESFARLAEDYYAFSAIDQVPRLEIPIYFLQGSQDFNTPTHIARKYFEALDAPCGKYWIEEETCAHMVFYEKPEAFLNICRRIRNAESGPLD